MKTLVFLGPSLELTTAKSLLPTAEFLPPVACGDVLRALEQAPDRLVIIDGFFHFQAAVWHKEILLALEQGIEVIGAASMGALRAAECAAFGMKGIGSVFDDFYSGQLTDDDEVAVLHHGAKNHYRSLSDAMVNIRAAIHWAIAQKLITEEQGKRLIVAAKNMHYPQRQLSTLLIKHIDCVKTLAQLQQALHNYDWNVKRQDAIAALEYVATHPKQVSAALVCSKTQALRSLENQIKTPQ